MKTFYAFMDVAYEGPLALSVAVLTTTSDTQAIAGRYWAIQNDPQDYQPASFYKRELPCILNVLEKVEEPLEAIFIDAYTWLPDGRPGLGAHLFGRLDSSIPVIGIAKSEFCTKEKTGIVKEVLRGHSRRPLYVSCAGIELEMAVKLVKGLAGPFRIPFPVKSAHILAAKKLKEVKG